MTHTKGPWANDEKVVGWWNGEQPGCMVRYWQGETGYALANCLTQSTGNKTAEANARRICACVNALEGFDIEAIEAGVVADLVEALREIAALNDKSANKHLELSGSYGCFDEPGSVRIARNALAKIGGAL